MRGSVSEWEAEDDHARERSTWSLDLGLGMLVYPVLGFLAFEWTSNPVIGVFIACLKPGLEDGRTALWLLRRDPRKVRGWACCWMFLTAGFWKTFAWSFVLVVVLLGVTEGLGGGGFVKASLDGSVYAMFFGFGILMVSSALAVGSALLSGTKVWVSREVHQARRADAWPPSQFVRVGAINQAAPLMLPMIVVLCLGLLIFCIAMISAASLLAMFIGCCLIMSLQNAIILRMLANHPYSCWPPERPISDEYPHDPTTLLDPRERW